MKAGPLRRSPAPLARDENEAAARSFPHHQGLNHPFRTDRLRELIELALVEHRPGLVGAGMDVLDAGEEEILAKRNPVATARYGKQGIQPASQSLDLHGHAAPLCSRARRCKNSSARAR